MASKIRALVKRQLHRSGWHLHRLSPSSNPSLQLLRGLGRFDINLVFDIGANEGQFARSLRSVGYRGKIVSFEPLSSAHLVLSSAAAQDKLWCVHSRTAIGDVEGEIEINVAGNSVSSSVLPMLDAHATAAADSAYIATERVPVARLDCLASEYLGQASRYFVKIDVQGYEWAVLDGAVETLREAQGILCELSLVPLYEGQHLWLEIIGRLEAEGLTLWAIQRGFTDPRDGRTLQIDAVFFRLAD